MRTESLKETAKRTLAARARTLEAAKLAWLTGFPLAVGEGSVRWLAVPPAAEVGELAVERSHLSGATYAVNKLRGELAAALPSLAEDPEAWLASVAARLALLKRAVHHGEPMPELFADPSLSRTVGEALSRLAAREPCLRPLLGALSWIHAGHPERLGASLAVAADWAAGAGLLASRLGEEPALRVLLRLVQLAVEQGAERVQALVSSLFDARFHDLPLDRGRDFAAQILAGCGRRRKVPLPEALPRGTLGRELAEWTSSLAPGNRRSRQQALRLYALAVPGPLVERWEGWWRATESFLVRARKLAALPYEPKGGQRLRAELDEHAKAVPPEIPASQLFAVLDRLGRGRAGYADRLAAVLSRVPAAATAPGRPHLLLYWAFLGTDGGVAAGLAGRLLEGFERYLHLCPLTGEALLEPWSRSASCDLGSFCLLEAELADDPPPSRRTVLGAYEHLAGVAARCGGLSPRAARLSVELFVQAGGRSELAERLFCSLLERGRAESWGRRESILLALRLCEEQPERFADVLAAIEDEEEGGQFPPTEWPAPVLSALAAGALGERVRESLASRQWARLLACGAKAVLLEAAEAGELPLPTIDPAEEGATPAGSGEWIERYPAPLHPVLHRLAAVLPKAEGKVERWLADDLPSTGRLEREIRGLEERLAAAASQAGEDAEDGGRRAALAARLASLQSRLAHSSLPPPARLERLRVRLERAWGAAVLDRWQADLDRALPAALQALLGTADIPPWLAEPRPLALLAAACRMHGKRRDLALRLFRVRAGPPPWDLRDAPENRLFVDRLPHLDWSAWIDGVGSETVTAANGRTLALALEDDPLEIFRMGAHFQTCLSPGGFNFFSVFANAADINKRVLYARDGEGGEGSEGGVVGRCLLALTAAGELLTYMPYCHDGGIGFDRICADFADRLAARMGTRRAASGRVPTLVAADWYDDGPYRLGRLADAFEEGSPLRRALATVAPGEVVAALRRSLKPARLHEDTLSRVLELPELERRPELAVPLLHLVAEERSLPPESVVTAARLALAAGAVEPVRRLFLEPVGDFVRRSLLREGWADPRAIALLERLDPARLLAYLRASRPRGRGFHEETRGFRLEAAAAALEALHRPRQARELWQRLATAPEVNASHEQRQRAEAALAAAGPARVEAPGRRGML